MSAITVSSKAREEVLDITADVADHVRAHVLAALVGPSVSVPIRAGRLALGQFQRIVLVELEGPRERTIVISG